MTTGFDAFFDVHTVPCRDSPSKVHSISMGGLHRSRKVGGGRKGRVFPAVGRADLPGERFRGVAFPGLHPPETGRLVPEPWAEAYFTAHLDKLNTSSPLSLNSPSP